MWDLNSIRDETYAGLCKHLQQGYSAISNARSLCCSLQWAQLWRVASIIPWRGFLSRLDIFQVQASDLSGSSLENSPHSFRDDQTQANSTNEGIDSTHVLNDPQIEVLDSAQVQNELANEILDDAQQNESANEILAGTCEQSDVEGNAGVGPSADVNQSRGQ